MESFKLEMMRNKEVEDKVGDPRVWVDANRRCWGRCSLRISTTRPLKQNSIIEQAAGKDS